MHLLLTQALSSGQLWSLRQPTAHMKLSQTSPLRQSLSLRHRGLQTPLTRSHCSLPRQPELDEQTGRQTASWHVALLSQSRFSVHGGAGALTHATCKHYLEFGDPTINNQLHIKSYEYSF